MRSVCGRLRDYDGDAVVRTSFRDRRRRVAGVRFEEQWIMMQMEAVGGFCERGVWVWKVLNVLSEL